MLIVLGFVWGFFLHVGKAVKGFKKRHLTAEECEALAQSARGSLSLTQPLSQRQSRGDENRGLHPTYRPHRRRGGTLLASASTAEGFGGGSCSCGAEQMEQTPHRTRADARRVLTEETGFERCWQNWALPLPQQGPSSRKKSHLGCFLLRGSEFGGTRAFLLTPGTSLCPITELQR